MCPKLGVTKRKRAGDREKTCPMEDRKKMANKETESLLSKKQEKVTIRSE